MSTYFSEIISFLNTKYAPRIRASLLHHFVKDTYSANLLRIERKKKVRSNSISTALFSVLISRDVELFKNLKYTKNMTHSRVLLLLQFSYITFFLYFFSLRYLFLFHSQLSSFLNSFFSLFLLSFRSIRLDKSVGKFL